MTINQNSPGNRGNLIGESARPRIYQEIRDAMLRSPHVEEVIHLRTQHFGPEQLLVGAKIAFDPDLTFDQLADAINGVEQHVREVVPIARPMYIEPDLVRAPTAIDRSDDHHD
jgi:divalent metal cation (Fe/Co/Zn/Cd) transporter